VHGGCKSRAMLACSTGYTSDGPSEPQHTSGLPLAWPLFQAVAHLASVGVVPLTLPAARCAGLYKRRSTQTLYTQSAWWIKVKYALHIFSPGVCGCCSTNSSRSSMCRSPSGPRLPVCSSRHSTRSSSSTPCTTTSSHAQFSFYTPCTICFRVFIIIPSCMF
jgi:hypothetical protein